ncbi:MAG: CRTAC1 family protein [Bryobacteraceae bacterium]
MKKLAALLLLVCSCSHRQESAAPRPIFRDAAPETGLVFEHATGATGEFLMPEIMGSGVALFDFDNDGDLDVYLVQSIGRGKLFRNELVPSGSLRFTDVTAASGIAFDSYGMGAATGDFDGDGRVDLLLTAWAQPGKPGRALYRNLGNGRFEAVPLPPEPLPNQWSSSASFFDYDRDGRLDLVILSYVNFTRALNKKCQTPAGEPDYCTPKAYSPVSARLYHNEGSRFTDVTEKAGLNRALGPGLGVLAMDFNGDSYPDLFVANDTAANHLWINQRDGTFREAAIESGLAYSEDGLAKAGMGVAAGDYDRDGRPDLLVLNLMREGATLFHNEGLTPQGAPSFADVSRRTGIYKETFAYTGFGAGWVDYDNDGWLDLFLANGAVTLREEQRGQKVPFKERNLLLHNEAGQKFINAAGAAGPVLALEEVTRGAAFGDIDNDGDIDILITNNGGPARLLLNEAPKSGWIGVQLEGKQSIGATVTLHRDGLPPLMRVVHTDSSYCSASDPRVVFGLGAQTSVSRIEVVWPDGSQRTLTAPQPGTYLTLK